MKNLLVKIYDFKEFKEITGEEPVFRNGFLNNNCDWWNLLEQKLGVPIISIRPSGRDGWKEILVIAAKGHIKDDIRYIFGNLTECKQIMSDIFMEAENDEYEVF